MDDNFSPRVKDVISFSKEEALRLGHDFIGKLFLTLVNRLSLHFLYLSMKKLIKITKGL